MLNKQKVISPFLTLYVGEFTSIISIFERITGVILFVGAILYHILISMRMEFLTNNVYYNIIYYIISSESTIITVISIYLLFVFCYHVIMGLKYLYWNSLSVEQVTLDEFNKVKINKFLTNLLYFILLVIIIIST